VATGVGAENIKASANKAAKANESINGEALAYQREKLICESVMKARRKAASAKKLKTAGVASWRKCQLMAQANGGLMIMAITLSLYLGRPGGSLAKSLACNGG